MEHPALMRATTLRLESELSVQAQIIFTPEEIEFEMATIIEVLEDCKGNVTSTQFNVSHLSAYEKLLQYHP